MSTNSSMPSDSAKKKDAEPLPDNPWGLLAFAVKALGDNASLVLVAAGVVAAFVMLQRERNAADDRIAAETKAANEALTSTYQKIAATSTGQIEGLEKVMQLSQTLTKTIAQQVTDVQTMNTTAEKLKNDANLLRDEMKKLEKDRERLQEVDADTRAWGNLFLLSQLAGDLAAAPTKNDATEIFKQIKEVQSPLIEDEDNSALALGLKEATTRLGDAMAEWVPVASDIDPSEVDQAASKTAYQQHANVQQACLALAQASRRLFGEAPQQLQDLIDGVRRVLYDQAVSVAFRLAGTDDWSEAAGDRREFLSLYWGKLVFVESREVEVAMVYFRRQLDELEKQHNEAGDYESRQAERHGLAEELRKACEIPGYKTPDPQSVKKGQGGDV